MNVVRAQQIIQSVEKITVTYNGSPVWIDEVDGQTMTARVHPENQPGQSMTVALDQLNEQEQQQ